MNSTNKELEDFKLEFSRGIVNFIYESIKTEVSKQIENHLFKSELTTAVKKEKIQYNANKKAILVLDLVCQVLELDKNDVLSTSKKRELAECRFIYCYITNKLMSEFLTLVGIGRLINRDHCSVMYCVKQALILKENNKSFALNLQACIKAYNLQFNINQ